MLKKIVNILILTLCFSICENVMANNTCAYFIQDKTISPEKKEKQRLANIKKELDAAKTNLKTGNNLNKSVSSLTKLIDTDTLCAKDIRLHSMLYDLVLKQYAQGNEQLYLQQKYDTANIYLLSHQLFLVANRLDSIDAIPNEKGKISMKYRKSNSTELCGFVKNLYGGIVYFVNKKRWNDAISLSDTYLQIQKWHLFSDTNLNIDSKHISHVAYMHLLAAYEQNKYSEVLQYDSLALCYESRHETTMEILVNTYKSMGDSVNYVSTLNKGVDAYPLSDFFFPQLVNYLSNSSKWEDALSVVNKRLAASPDDIVAKSTKQTLLLNMNRFDDCISLGKEILAADSNVEDANFNTAIAYWNKSLEVQKQITNAKERNNKLVELYKLCRPYMEMYRKMRPDDKEHWKPVLYTIYLNLNLGKEFSEIEKL